MSYFDYYMNRCELQMSEEKVKMSDEKVTLHVTRHYRVEISKADYEKIKDKNPQEFAWKATYVFDHFENSPMVYVDTEGNGKWFTWDDVFRDDDNIVCGPIRWGAEELHTEVKLP